MSLTSELQNKNSKINNFFYTFLSEKKLINFLSKNQPTNKTIYPLKNSDILAVGSAVPYIYCYYKYNKWGIESSGVFNRGIKKLNKIESERILQYLKGIKKENDSAIALGGLLVAGIVLLGRKNLLTDYFNDIKNLSNNYKRLPDLSFSNQNIIDTTNSLYPTMCDLINIISNLKIKNLIEEKEELIGINKRFRYSNCVGGADAQIFSKTNKGLKIVSTKTSSIKYPFTIDMIKQQLGYFILDGGENNITEIEWVFARQGSIHTYNIDDLLNEIRIDNKNTSEILPTLPRLLQV